MTEIDGIGAVKEIIEVLNKYELTNEEQLNALSSIIGTIMQAFIKKDPEQAYERAAAIIVMVTEKLLAIRDNRHGVR